MGEGDQGVSRADFEIRWLAPDENPWGVPVLDVRPVTLGMMSTSRDPECAANAVSFAHDDGTGFIGVQPAVSREIRASLKFRVDLMLADGALFIPRGMEHKWAIYFHQGKIICVRSWLRTVAAIAETRTSADFLEICRIRGVLCDEDEEPQFTVHTLDFLLRTHALELPFPAPIPDVLASDPNTAALWCMSCFGNRAEFATPHVVSADPPTEPLRSDSLLHIAVARGEADNVARFLDAGVPITLLARDGLAAMHWALARQDTPMLSLLLERGSPIDVRSVEGATPLMNAVQAPSPAHVDFLLRHGADPNAVDNRGFTALHRAAEMGQIDIVRLLLDRGASPRVQAQGHTPRSLAAARGEQTVVELLDRRISD